MKRPRSGFICSRSYDTLLGNYVCRLTPPYKPNASFRLIAALLSTNPTIHFQSERGRKPQNLSQTERKTLVFCTPMTYSLIMVFIETPIFTKRVKELLADEEYRSLQEALLLRPEAGAVIPGGGRWWLTQNSLACSWQRQTRRCSGNLLLGYTG